ncbi:GIY-YIG nuclease family protein [Cupriavidus sp. RAF20_2]|jgi:hypothetical protein|uniref:GIY-YIG nuclease family protein n=1 Tax=Cupriavidus sp. RAF20_2 TaxID=3233053 RepID=UPI003F8F5993
MFKTADGDTLELAPWRMRRLMGLVAAMRRYPPGTPPQALVNDLRLIIARARRVSTQPRLGMARFESTDACCRACLLARQQPRGGMELVGLQLAAPRPGGHLYEGFAPELEEEVTREVNVTLAWRRFESLKLAVDDRTVSGPGVYILVRGTTPIYVGLSKTLGSRMKQHRWCAGVHGALRGLGVWVASVRKEKDLSAVEHAVIRALRGSIHNSALVGDVLLAGPSGITIVNILPPSLLRRATHINAFRTGDDKRTLAMKSGEKLELEWRLP